VTKPTRALVIEKIRRVFPERPVADVLALLDRYGAEDHHREKARVQLAVLKLCDEEKQGDPADTVEKARADYRDVLAWADSPNLIRKTSCQDPAEREKLIAQDRAQYLAWLEKR
jgi:hypothetical protein